MRFLPALPKRRTADSDALAIKARERAAEESRRRLEQDAREAARAGARAAREASRAQARAAREEAATRWARRALSVKTATGMEAVLWFCTVLALGVAYALSYSHQAGVFEQLDYAGWEHSVVPLALDLPLTASVAALYLAARWKSPPLQRWIYRGTTLLTAPLSLGANALHGSVHAGQVDWARVTEPVHLVASLVPALIVLTCVIVAETTFGEKARLDELAGRSGPVHEPPTDPGPALAEASHGTPSGPAHPPVPQVTLEVSHGTVDHPVHGPVHATPAKPARGTADRVARNVSRGTRPKPARGTPDGPVHGTPDPVGQIASHLATVRDAGGDPGAASVRSIADATGVPRTTVSRNLQAALAVLARPRVMPAEDQSPPAPEADASPESLRS